MAGVGMWLAVAPVIQASQVHSTGLPANLMLGAMVVLAALCAILLFIRMGPKHAEQSVLAADPALSASAVRGYALALVDAQRLAEAEEAIRVHLVRTPSDTRIRGLYAALLAHRNEHQQAADELERTYHFLRNDAQQLTSHNATYLALVKTTSAVELEALGQQDRANTAMRDALALDPGAGAYRSSCLRLIAEAARETELERYIFERLTAWEHGKANARVFGFTDATAGMRFYRRAVAQQPHDGRLLAAYAQALHATGDHRAAEQTFRQALQQSPADPWIHLDFGTFLWRLDRFPEADQELAEATHTGQQHAAVRATFAAFLLAQGRAPDAEREMLAALRARPDVWALARLFGTILVTQGKLPQAARAYQEAERLGASDAAFRILYGDVLMRLDQPQAAEEQYRRAIWSDADNGGAHARYGAFLFAAGRLAEAEETLRRAVLLAGGEQGYVDLAGLLLLERKLDEALPYLRHALESESRNSLAQEYQAEWQLLRGRPEEAINVARALIDQGTLRGSLYLILGGALLALNRQLEAQAALREAVRVDPSLPATLLQQARALQAHGAIGAALETVAQALAVQPGWPDALAEQQTLMHEQASTAAARPPSQRSRS